MRPCGSVRGDENLTPATCRVPHGAFHLMDKTDRRDKAVCTDVAWQGTIRPFHVPFTRVNSQQAVRSLRSTGERPEVKRSNENGGYLVAVLVSVR